MSLNLDQEFPEKANLIKNLKIKDRHFSRLFDEYQELGSALVQNPAASQEKTEALKIRRLYLRDKLISMLED
ncbi:MAG: hypothetical protein RL217_377 [Pseudomonadota bacterium]|jgi:uncharacterized protein YdcH (DUF465 family)